MRLNNIFQYILAGGCQDKVGALFYTPTILTEVTTEMDCFKNEIFGPVVAIKRFSSEKVKLIYIYLILKPRSYNIPFMVLYFQNNINSMYSRRYLNWRMTVE